MGLEVLRPLPAGPVRRWRKTGSEPHSVRTVQAAADQCSAAFSGQRAQSVGGVGHFSPVTPAAAGAHR